MRVLVLADLEGASGFDGTPSENEAARSESMAGDINAAVRGLVRAGASAVDVIDAHGMGGNVDPKDVAPPAGVLGGTLALAQLMLHPAEARSYAAWVLLGCHAMAGTPDGFMAHTNQGMAVAGLRINGRETGEIAEFAWLAGSMGVAVAAVAGDEAACREARLFIPDVQTAAVKTATAGRRARCLPPQLALSLIEEACYRGLADIGSRSPTVLDGPVRMEVTFKVAEAVPLAAVLPRSAVDGATVAYEAADYGEALRAYLCTLALAGSSAMIRR
ncbi:MAG: M55 family metallopeptidase [Bacillota bacterium]|nr:M55 family metallopeptidase [Bacillota bacterium]